MTSVRRRGLPPILAPDARVLLLGSFPGDASLAARQYYAHPRNHFWPLLGEVLGEPLAGLPYAQRLACAQAHGIGLWDTIVSCERPGSLDSSIRAARLAETRRVRRSAPGVWLVCFNGKTAARAESAWREAGYQTLALPSTSPAYTLPFEAKLAAWIAIRARLADGPPAATQRVDRASMPDMQPSPVAGRPPRAAVAR